VSEQWESEHGDDTLANAVLDIADAILLQPPPGPWAVAAELRALVATFRAARTSQEADRG